VLACVHAMCVRTPYTIDLGIASVVCLHAGQRLRTFLQREEEQNKALVLLLSLGAAVFYHALMRRQSGLHAPASLLSRKTCGTLFYHALMRR
jgi:hypothetical protein